MDFPLFSRDGRDHGLDVPDPIRAGVPLAALGVIPLVLGLADIVRPLSGLVFAGVFVVAGLLRASLALYELRDLRRRADRQLRRERDPSLRSALVSWRAAELTSPRRRRSLARSVGRIEHEVSPGTLPSASPINRVAVRPHVDLVRLIAERLETLDRPVPPAAVLQLEELLTAPESPLYTPERAADVRPSLLASLEALDGSTPAAG